MNFDEFIFNGDLVVVQSVLINFHIYFVKYNE